MKRVRKKDYKSQRNKKFSMRFHLLEMSEKLRPMKSHQNIYQRETQTRTILTDMLMWKEELSCGLNPR